MAEVAHAIVDGNDRLVEADDALLGLNKRAGGGADARLAVPQLASLTRLARRLHVPVARNVTVGDRDADIELFVRASPDGDRVRLSVAGWRERRPWRPTGAEVERDLLAGGVDWSWESDATLRIRFLSLDADPRYGLDAIGLLGSPLTDLFGFEPDADGGLPILDALANRRSFSRQPARLRPSGGPVTVSAQARRDRDGNFAGFVGGVVAADPPSSPSPSTGATIGDRLENALRTPLGLIIANADSINAQSDGPIAPDYAAYAADIASAGRHLMALMDDLADLRAVESPSLPLELEPVDLADLARRAAGLLSVRAVNAGVAIRRPGPDEHVPAIGDFRRVLQILVNLIGNALRYAPEGSEVAVTVAADASVTVADQGHGVAAEDQARIFEKFERVDATEPGGSGLGLYIARRLARAMGGDVTVRSAPGQGARFTLSLAPDAPRDEDQQQA